MPDFASTLSSAVAPIADSLGRLGEEHDGFPAPGSMFERDWEAAEERLTLTADDHNPMTFVRYFFEIRRFAVQDYLRAIATLAREGGNPSGPIVYSPAPVARAAVEALRDIHWLADPDIDERERTRRLCRDVLDDLKTQHRLVPLARAAGVEPSLGVDDLADMCRMFKIDFEWGKPNSETNVAMPEVEGPGRGSTFATMQDLLPVDDMPHLGPVFYSFASDVAHASTRGLLGRAELLADESAGSVTHARLDRENELKRLVPLIFALLTPFERYITYHGWTYEDFRDEMTKCTELLNVG